MKKITLTAIGLMALAFVACKKDEDKGSSFSYQVKASNGSTYSTASTSKETNTVGVTVGTTSLINFTAGSLLVSEVDFEAEKDEAAGQNEDNTEVAFEFEGPIKIDLFGTSQPFGDVKVVAGAYEEIELSVKFKKSATEPAVSLSGTFGTIPVQVVINDELEFEAEYENIVVNEEMDYLGLVHLNLNLLSTGITAAELEAAVKTNGKIVISSTSNQAIYAKMLANLHAVADVEFENED
ncbi:hypothetical protein [Solitalea lacus]|uniref:hypothetical protein n=1 Tax=Solitalea lacus TaxID=2911172 RepID=UPI001EDA9B4F|nr:hypothetical protein [Solitalea lacus]UKJ09195.1 hypothetical protein L2B55_08570 [Solitalea lacus]